MLLASSNHGRQKAGENYTDHAFVQSYRTHFPLIFSPYKVAEEVGSITSRYSRRSDRTRVTGGNRVYCRSECCAA